MAVFSHGEETRSCPLQLGLALLGGRWRALILHHVGLGVTRFGALKRAIDGISERMLARELKELVRLGFLTRTDHAEVPPRTDYQLTALGREARDALEPLRRWGKRFKVDGAPPALTTPASSAAGRASAASTRSA